jgi:hypothetical protein
LRDRLLCFSKLPGAFERGQGRIRRFHGPKRAVCQGEASRMLTVGQDHDYHPSNCRTAVGCCRAGPYFGPGGRGSPDSQRHLQYCRPDGRALCRHRTFFESRSCGHASPRSLIRLSDAGCRPRQPTSF